MAIKEKIVGSKKSLKKKKVERWSQSTRIGEITKEIEVEKLFNGGFLVIVSKHGEDSKGKWINNSIKTYSEDNPLDPEVTVDPLTSIFDTLSRNRNN